MDEDRTYEAAQGTQQGRGLQRHSSCMSYRGSGFESQWTRNYRHVCLWRNIFRSEVPTLSLKSSEHRSADNIFYPLLPSTQSANAALCGRCTVNKSTISALEIRPISFPRCVKRICRRFYERLHVSLSGRKTTGKKRRIPSYGSCLPRVLVVPLSEVLELKLP